jgi:hypothetical protein
MMLSELSKMRAKMLMKRMNLKRRKSARKYQRQELVILIEALWIMVL